MIGQPAAFTVLSTPVALCDRRALSEAWFSALHMHKERGQGPRSSRKAIAAGTQAGRRAAAEKPPLAERPAPALSTAMRIGAASGLAGAPGTERRTVRTNLALKIERAFCKPQNSPKHASFSLEGERGRVQILLRNAGMSTQIVALCPPSAREVVATALSQARYALALRGISIQADIRGFVQ